MTSNANPPLALALSALIPQSGHVPSAMEGVTLMRADRSLPAAPVLQEPTIVVLAQGLKRGYLGSEVMAYRPGQCLLVAVPMHFDCDTVVEDGQPMLALAVKVDLDITRELLSKMQRPQAPVQAGASLGMAVIDLDDRTRELLARLLAALADPEDAQILGRQLVRELHYRMLKSPGGEILGSVVGWQGRLGAIYRACERIRAHYAQDLDIATLAGAASMSHSAFHQAFRAVTGYSPIQYLKATRLQRAHEFLKVGGLGVAQAAYEVGYASASQFSREFKRMFGYSPVDAAGHGQDCTDGQKAVFEKAL
jgi:AraC-like DNA-binding protein